MNKRSIVISGVIFLMVFGSVLMTAGPDKQKRKRLPGKGKMVVIAKIDAESGKIKIRERILRKEFADGGKIERFEVKEFVDGYNLLRIGKSKDGNNHVEAFPLKLKTNVLVLGEVKWFVKCDIASGCFCRPNFQKTACECADGTDCTFGRGSSEGMGIDYVLVTDPEYPRK